MAAAWAAAQRLVKLAAELGKNTDSTIRQKLAQLYTLQQIGRYSALRAKSPGQRTGAEPNIAKLMMSDLLRLQREVGNEIIGANGMIMGTDTPGGGTVQEIDAVLARSVDLRRHRSGPAQHHRRTRARPARRSPGPRRTRRSASCSSIAESRLRFGVVILPEWRWADARGVWQHAEDLRFDHAWTYDHLAWRTMRDQAWFGAIPTLTAAALATSRLRLGTLVASISFRHPVSFAKELITLDDVSGGRLTLGIGAGGSGFDAIMLGEPAWPPRERGERFVEFVDLTDKLLREPAVSYAGRYYKAEDARTYPGCVQRPRIPFAVAATGPAGMALAARLGDAWVTTGPRHSPAPLAPKEGADAVRDQMARVEEACIAIGRDPRTLDRLVLTGPELDSAMSSTGAFEDAVGEYAAIGVTDLVVHWPRETGPFAGDRDVFERIFS